MYAYVINNAWQQWSSKDMGSFLREIGTPILKTDITDTNTFHSASGFYVYVQEGWTVRFEPHLDSQINCTHSLSVIMNSLHI